jgi:hypothetical protein
VFFKVILDLVIQFNFPFECFQVPRSDNFFISSKIICLLVYNKTFLSYVCYNSAEISPKVLLGMPGFDGRGWLRNASREVPNSKNQHKKSSANRTSYAAMPLAA